jgi:hypothetical protein
MDSLPDGHPMIQSQLFIGNGLALWHGFTRTFIMVATSQMHAELLRKFISETKRAADEDVITYFARLQLDALRINEGQENLIINPEYFRKRFLLTLGDEFAYLVTADTEGTLAPFYMTWTDDELLDHLQGILTTKKTLNTYVATASTLGYANAMTVSSTSKTDLLQAENENLRRQNAALQSERDADLARRLAAQERQQAEYENGPDFYCWTHGIGKNPGHNSDSCQRKATGHKKEATLHNRMGGSNERIKRKQH